MLATARAYRQAIRKHDIPELDARILSAALEYSYEFPEPRFEAWFPTQRALGILARVPEGKTSEALRRLVPGRALTIRSAEAGLWLALEPPAGWAFKLRAAAPCADDLERWLNNAHGETPWLLAIPPSLNDVLRENFAQTMGESTNARSERANTASLDAGSRCPHPDTPAPFVDSESAKNFPQREVPDGPAPSLSGKIFPQREVPTQGTTSPRGKIFPLGEVPGGEPAPVPCTTRARVGSIDRSDRLINESIDRSIEAQRFGPELGARRQDLAADLFALIGQDERTGRCSRRWQLYLTELSIEQIEQAISEARHVQKTTGFRKNIAAYLNGALGKLLDQKLQASSQ